MPIATSEHFMKRFCRDALVEALVRVLSSHPKLVCSINGRSSRLMLAPPLAEMATVKPALLQKPTLTLATRKEKKKPVMAKLLATKMVLEHASI